MTPEDPRRDIGQKGYPRCMAMETQTAEQIEEESIGGNSEVEVLEPLEGHTTSNVKPHNSRYFCSKRFKVSLFILLSTTNWSALRQHMN